MDFERERYTRLQSERHNDVLVLSEICQACMNFVLIFSRVWCPISQGMSINRFMRGQVVSIG